MSKLDELKSNQIKLDDIIETFILDTEKSEEDAIGKYESRTTLALLSYTKNICEKYGKNVNYEQAADIMEDVGADLLDAIYDTNRIYSRHGMQIGAHLLMDLLLAD